MGDFAVSFRALSPKNDRRYSKFNFCMGRRYMHSKQLSLSLLKIISSYVVIVRVRVVLKKNCCW